MRPSLSPVVDFPSILLPLLVFFIHPRSPEHRVMNDLFGDTSTYRIFLAPLIPSLRVSSSLARKFAPKKFQTIADSPALLPS